MADKCPYCFRSIGTWTNDPLLLPEGALHDWSSDTELISVPNIDARYYKGFSQIKEEDVKEIQDSLKTLEEENLDEGERTKFSPLNSSGYFQITGQHIKEMRESVEKLLDILGLTKGDYFNYDEDGNHIIRPDGDKTEWTDYVENEQDWDKFQVKAIHIEDLRHYIMIILLERWNVSPVGIVTGSTIEGDLGTWELANSGLNEEVGPIDIGYYFPSYTATNLVFEDTKIITTSFEIKETEGENPNKYAKLVSRGGIIASQFSWAAPAGYYRTWTLGGQIALQTTGLPIVAMTIDMEPMIIEENQEFSALCNIDFARVFCSVSENFEIYPPPPPYEATIYNFCSYAELHFIITFKKLSNLSITYTYTIKYRGDWGWWVAPASGPPSIIVPEIFDYGTTIIEWRRLLDLPTNEDFIVTLDLWSRYSEDLAITSIAVEIPYASFAESGTYGQDIVRWMEGTMVETIISPDDNLPSDWATHVNPLSMGEILGREDYYFSLNKFDDIGVKDKVIP